MSYGFEDVAKKLLTLDAARARLASTEPLAQYTFPMHGAEAPSFHLNAGWNVGLASKAGTETVDASIKVNGQEFYMTKDAVLEAASNIGLSRQYLSKTPAALIEPHLNYHYQHQERECKILASNDLALAFTKATINPFSNLQLLDGAVDKIHERFGADTEIFVDFKFHHDLRLTRVRLILPGDVTKITNDKWSTGLQIQNSLTGSATTGLRGYLFTWACTNGMISTHASSGNWNRKRQGQSEDVYDWARESVDGIFDSLGHELESVAEIASQPLLQPLEGVLQDIFRTYKIALAARPLIIERLVNRQAESDEPLTMYDIQAVVTSVANELEAPETMRNSLMEIGGDLPRAYAERCNTCHRLAID